MRNREQVIWDFVQQWLKKGESDLKAAKILLGTEVDDYFSCAFHSQQAAEKFLKAFLVCHQIEFRKTHDLDELLNLTDSADSSLRQEIGSCVWLSPYGVEFRYPGEYPVVDHNTAEKAYKESELVRQAVMKRLEEFLSKGRPD
ncbi:MAG: DNA-binding protein [candidate division Zixibacteria bacterium SM1_73]|nr:MAG: DNA-binding protein [candidate division Zixibacteria bacterium SM1_73]